MRAHDALAAERRRSRRWPSRRRTNSRAPGQGKAARFVRGSPSVDRLSRFLRARGVRLARPYLPRLLAGNRSGRPLAHLNARGTTLAFASRAPRQTSSAGRDEWTGRCLATRSPTASTRTSAWTSDTGTMSSSATATRCSAHIPTAAATRRWGPSGATPDLTPLSRQETWEDSPEGYPQSRIGFTARYRFLAWAWDTATPSPAACPAALTRYSCLCSTE